MKIKKENPKFIPDDEGLKVSNLMNYSFYLLPVHKELLKTEEMNRLYTLRQLSFCYVLDFESENMGYISTTHSRLEHSILVADYARYFFREKHLPYSFEQKHIETAALLHDCGHTACSHAFELDTIRSQEHQVHDIIFGNGDNDRNSVSEVLEKHGMDKKIIFEIITEKNNNFETMLISQFCDRLAYIVEDAQRSHSKILMDRYRGGSLKTSKTILEDCLFEKDKELQAELCYSEINKPNLIEGEIHDLEWIDMVAAMCCSRTQLFMNVYGSPSNSKCVTLARNGVQTGKEEGWIDDEKLYYLNDEQLIKMFSEHESTRKIGEQLKSRVLPKTALAVSLDEEDYKQVNELQTKRDKRVELEEKIGGYIDINPLAKFSLPKIKFQAKNEKGNLGDLLLKTCSDVLSYKRMHDAWITRRFVVYALPENNPEKVAENTVNELGLALEDCDFISLHGFEIK